MDYLILRLQRQPLHVVLTRASQFTIAIETGVQNVPLSHTIASTLLANPRLALTPAAYGLFMSIMLIPILYGVMLGWPLLTFSTDVVWAEQD